MPDSNRRISARTRTHYGYYGYGLLLSGRSRLLWPTWPLELRSRSSINLRSSRISSHICGPIEIHLEKWMWRLDKNTLIQPPDTPTLSQEFQVPQFGQRLYRKHVSNVPHGGGRKSKTVSLHVESIGRCSETEDGGITKQTPTRRRHLSR
jgi:hypothetical protein